MPLNEAPWELPAVEVETDPGRARLRKLAHVLRHREEWPTQHRWDFTSVDAYEEDRDGCGTAGCAIGIARLMWPKASIQKTMYFMDRATVAAFFSMPQDRVDQIFYDNEIYDKAWEAVTPEDVAGAIEAFLATGAA